MQHVHAPASQAEHGLCVAFALASLAVIVSPRRWMLQAREGREIECVLQAVVAKPGDSVAANGGAGLVRSGTKSGVCGQLCCGTKLANVADFDQDARPEARADPRQALNDARLSSGRAKKARSISFSIS